MIYLKVYLDLVFFMNFGFDFLLLLTVNLVLKRNRKLSSVLLGSAIGALSIFFLFLPLNSVTLFLLKILVSFLMIWTTFGFFSWKTFLINTLYLYFISILLGGFLYYLNLEFSYQNQGLIFFHNGFSINFILLFILSPFILWCYLKQIKSFVKQGLTVVGPAPEYSPSLCNYPAADQEVQALAAELWAYKNYGKGKVFPTDCSLEDVFKELGVPADCRFTNNVPVVFIHRSLREGDIYFLSNQSEAATSFEATFRVNGKQPELWNPLTNEIRLLPEYAEADSLTTVPLQLAPGESTFIVFRKPVAQEKAEGTNYPAAQNVATLASGWTVKFEDERQGVTEPVALDSLADWTAFTDERIKYYSGTATYTNSFVLESVPKHPLYIDLGKVSAMAKVEINGQYAGGVWTYPYRLNISPYVKQGDNTVRIEVVNTWLNRIIGDHRVPEAQRVTRIIGNWANPWNADSPLQPSGLFGPVEIASHDYCSLEYRPFVP